MATKIGRTLLLAIIAMSCMYSTCKKGIGGCADTVYSFELGIKAYPDKDSLQIGDTL